MSEHDERRLLEQAQAASTAVKNRANLEVPSRHLIGDNISD
jgi:hypothetical protein